MVKHFLIISLFICICKFGISQDIPKFIPPSPESVSLAKFIETPVSYYTGLPDISIPIYTINEKGVSIPVSVNYHARGIKVEEIASRVGIGWALNYGGSISRQIRGSADESPNGYLNLNIYNDFFTNEATRLSAWSYYSNQPDYDFIPDQFYLNANNISGKFIFDQIDGQPVLQKFNNVTISYTIENSEIASFVVKDSEGNTYYFGKSKDGSRTAIDYEDTQLITQVLGSSPVLSNPDEREFNSWHLMEIETPDNGRIEFYYIPEEPKFYRRLYDKANSENIPESFFSYVEGHQCQLSEIRFSTGKLVFTPSNSIREDLNNAYALDHVTLYDLNNSIKKKFQFSYEYTTAPDNGNQLDYLKNNESQAAKRLFLESIQEVDNQSAALPPYTFDYNTTILPNRFSNSQDVWGYYNGANNGQFLTFFNYSTFNVDRSVNSANSEAGLLKKITYPTGGSTQFTYEQNIALPNPDLNELVYQSINPAEEKENGLGFLETSYYDGIEYTKSISIGNIVGVVDVSCWVQNVNIMDFIFSIQPTSGGKVNVLRNATSITLDPGDYYLTVTPKISGFDTLNLDHAFNINLSWKEQSVNESDSVYAGGKRILKVENKLPDNSPASIREFKYKDSDGVSSGKIFGVPNCYSINKTLSTGAFKVFLPYGAVPGSPLSMGTDNTIGYTSVVEYLGSISNNTGKTEYEFTDIENTGDYYRFPYSIPTDNEWLRGKPLSIKNYKRNTNGTFELVRKIENEYLYGDYVNQSGGSSPNVFIPFLGMANPILDTTNISPPLDRLYLKNKRLFRFPLAIFASVLDDYGSIILDVHYYKVYYLTGGALDLKKTITTEYTSGVPNIVTSNEYFYNYDDHYQLSRTETTNSNGIVNKKNFWYPSDYNLGVENFNTLITNNIVGKPIDVRTYNGINLASGSQTRYNNYGQPIDVYRFESTATDIALSASNPYTFSHKQQIGYNSSSRIKRTTPDNNVSTYYVWAYNNQYPVVKIETSNASLAIDQIQSSIDGISLSESQSKTLIDSSISSLQTAVGAYVSSSDMVTYYTYTSLTGMTSQTDPNGVTTYYEYDSFGRLKLIKDDDGHILKTYDYHYKQ